MFSVNVESYACPYPDPYNLKTPDDTYYYASQKLWKQFRLLLSLKWQERKEQLVAQLPLQTLINSTNWYMRIVKDCNWVTI
ncbi:hypothetical protein DAPPUDRAFT_250624 [Daphnia pulex]|uniref:Uncharacterized protein n=1 Tax=Daphnia pulex TaxID=6669 RepID=E9GYZ6_DAPPU|nr:hypothetical protein DAPPUDRAFT_250624 [Daphnia pulex]|eukprot:EFX75241.1 hypothetical protein DAPPUDRAFT_250624 [Daphnia pulex]